MASANNTEGQSRSDRILKRTARLIAGEDTGRAIRFLERLMRVGCDARSGIEAELQKAECLLIERRIPEARTALDNLLQLTLARDHDLRRQVLTSYCLVLLGRPREAVALAKHALSNRERLDDIGAEALLVIGLGLLRTGHYAWAERTLQRAAAYFRLAGMDVKLAYCLIDLGLVAKNRSRLQEALLHFDESNRLIAGKPAIRTRLLLLVNRGICLLQLGRIEQARTSLLRAHAIAEETRNWFVMIGVKNNLGHVYRLEGNFETAIDFHKDALHGAREAGAARKECLSLEFLGETFLETGDPQQALSYLNNAYKLATQYAGHGDLVGEILRRRGETHQALGDSSAARSDLVRAIEICRCRGERRERALARRSLALLDWDHESLATVMDVLHSLDEIGDRFEYGRTVFLTLRRPALPQSALAHLNDAIVKANYFFQVSGSPYWKKKMTIVEGPARNLSSPAGKSAGHQPPVGSRSAAFLSTLEAARVAARGDGPALIQGETGAGKEVIARLIHEWSNRSRLPLVAINCGALPENLIESELFGHTRGAFTSAERDKKGLFETAHGGTVLLDEVTELTLQAQVKLLRFLDQGDLRQVGGTKTTRADIRILSATNKNVGELVFRGLFREDLMYRLNVFRIVVPPLRERPDDILPLAEVFLVEESTTGLELKFSEEVRDWLRGYQWPGNVRELRNLCEYFAARAWDRHTIELADLPKDLDVAASPRAGQAASAFERERQALERSQIIRALERTAGNISHAASLLGLGRNTVSRRMRDLGIKKGPFVDSMGS